MSMTSAAEASLDARIRPEISALRAKTPYPRRRSDGEAKPSAARESSPAVQPGPIRLTKRGRIVVWTLVAAGLAVLTAAIWLAVAGQAQASGHTGGGGPAGSPPSKSVLRVVVKQGQTLWGIASQVDPSVDPRVVIPEIVDLNSLAGTSIAVGQVLLVPTS